MRGKVIRALSVLILTIILSIGLLVIFNGCTRETSYNVRFEVSNAELGKFTSEDTSRYKVTAKYNGEPKAFNMRVYSVEQRKYLSDRDMTQGDLNNLITWTIKKCDGDEDIYIGSWPEDAGSYNIVFRFNMPPVTFDERDGKYESAEVIIDLTIER